MNVIFSKAICAALTVSLSAPVGAEAPKSEAALAAHVLDRLAFGPRPGDVDRVMRTGFDRWIDLQLRPDAIADPDVDARIRGLETAGLSTEELLKGYEIPREAKKKLQEARSRMGDAATERERQRARREILAPYADKLDGPPRQIVDELQQAKLLRAIYSERQLGDVLVDFWMNHFNVYARKGRALYLVPSFERDVIRPRAWGRFEDLLKATAESPAMLFYLDNWLSNGAGEPSPRRPGRIRTRGGSFDAPTPAAPAGARRAGLNENYARELLELHTMGVDGGYTQHDVTEVARAFTGWTIRGFKDQRAEFFFDPRRHDPGDKTVLGETVRGSGKQEGELVLHRLATHPKTARFVSYKLARRFVADEPPEALVERAAAVFTKTEGDIREVVRAIVTSPEFRSPQFYSAKVKTPLEFATSAVRALGATVDDAEELSRRVAAMGMPLYLQPPPTGYKDTADAWVATGGLVARLNLALDLSAGRVRGIRVPPETLSGDREALVARLVPAGLSPSTRRTIEGEGGDESVRTVGLLLGSPEFQRK